MASATADYPPARRWRPSAVRSFAITTALLVGFNILRALGYLGPPLVSGTLLTVALVVVALVTRTSLGELGLRRSDMAAGLRYGAAAFGVILLVVLLAALVPATNGFLHDARAELAPGQLLYRLGVSILLLTAVPEELAFRGLLLGSAGTLWGHGRASLVSSGLFGLWHIAPTLVTLAGNRAARDLTEGLGGQAALVLGAVGATFIAGLAFCWLRLRSGSLLAPLTAHFATNAVTLTVAWFVVH